MSLLYRLKFANVKKRVYLCAQFERMIKKQDIKSVIKAMRKQRRDEELATYGKPISFVRVVKSKKLYSRKVKHKSVWK